MRNCYPTTGSRDSLVERFVHQLIRAIFGLLILGMTPELQAAATTHEEAVIVRFDYGQRDWGPFFAFEKTLEDAITNASVGDYDGNALATDGSDGSMYMYGPDADALFAVVKPHLLAAKFMKNIRVTLRHGSVQDPNVRESRIQLKR